MPFPPAGLIPDPSSGICDSAHECGMGSVNRSARPHNKDVNSHGHNGTAYNSASCNGTTNMVSGGTAQLTVTYPCSFAVYGKSFGTCTLGFISSKSLVFLNFPTDLLVPHLLFSGQAFPRIKREALEELSFPRCAEVSAPLGIQAGAGRGD